MLTLPLPLLLDHCIITILISNSWLYLIYTVHVTWRRPSALTCLGRFSRLPMQTAVPLSLPQTFLLFTSTFAWCSFELESIHQVNSVILVPHRLLRARTTSNRGPFAPWMRFWWVVPQHITNYSRQVKYSIANTDMNIVPSGRTRPKTRIPTPPLPLQRRAQWYRLRIKSALSACIGVCPSFRSSKLSTPKYYRIVGN